MTTRGHTWREPALFAAALEALVVVAGCGGDRRTIGAPTNQQGAVSRAPGAAVVAPDASPPEKARATAWFGSTLDTAPVDATDDSVPPEPMPESAYVRSRDPLQLKGATLQSPCVEPKLHSLRDIFKAPDEARQTQLGDPSGMSLDLDGDKTPDFILDSGAARWQTDYSLYVRRGDCGYFVGVVSSSGSLRPMRARSKGLCDLHTSSDECPLAFPKEVMHQYCETIWRFDGRQYVRFRETPTKVRPERIQP